MHRSLLLLLPITGLLLAAACSNEPAPQQQTVAVCFSPEGDVPSTGNYYVEFKQDGKVVGTGSITPGIALSSVVPTGKIEVYANGDYYGEGYAAPSDSSDDATTTVGGFYLGGVGCPEEAPPVAS